MRSLVGKVHRWHRSTLKLPIANGWRLDRWRRCRVRTKLQHLCPHLGRRCGRQDEKVNEIRGKFLWWCGREDSNLCQVTDLLRGDSDNSTRKRTIAGNRR